MQGGITILKVFGMTWLGTEPRSPGPLANILPTVYICLSLHLSPFLSTNTVSELQSLRNTGLCKCNTFFTHQTSHRVAFSCFLFWKLYLSTRGMVQLHTISTNDFQQRCVDQWQIRWNKGVESQRDNFWKKKLNVLFIIHFCVDKCSFSLDIFSTNWNINFSWMEILPTESPTNKADHRFIGKFW